MDMKLNHSDFSALFAKVLGISQADGEAFTKTFFDTIVEGLEKEGSVKINGLGTFKIVEVDSRSSVNVNTGERFEIKGHKKMTFLPADSLKETINAPFAMFEPVEVDDELVDEEADAENVVDEDVAEVVEDVQPVVVAPQVVPISEIEEEMPAEAESVAAQVVAEYEEEMPVEPEVPAPATIKIKSVPAPESKGSDVVVAEQSADADIVVEPMVNGGLSEELHTAIVEPVEVTTEVKTSIEQQQQQTQEQKKQQPVGEKVVESSRRRNGYDYSNAMSRERRNVNMRPVFVALLVLLLAGGSIAGYYIFGNEPEITKNTPPTDKPVTTAKANKVASDTLKHIATLAPKDTLNNAVLPTDKESTEYKFVITAALEARKLADISVDDTVDYKMLGSVCEHKVEIDETLIKISLKHYGDKRLWPYIVAYNTMSRPNDLACGMLLKIPKLFPVK